MEAFSDWIQNQELVDLPLFGATYTRTNGRRDQIQSRLDRLLSTDWLEGFPTSSQLALPRTTSDHCPIMLSTEEDNWGPKPLRFNSAWLQIDGFHQKIVEWWSIFQVDGFAWHRLLCKLRLLKERLKEWKEGELRKRHADTEALFFELQRLDEEAKGGSIYIKRLSRCIQIIQSLSARALEDEVSWKLKSRVRWISEGDRNTRRFHYIANMQARAKSINVDGTQIDDKQEIAEQAIRHFQSLLSSEGWSRPTLDGISFDQLEDTEASLLEVPFSEEVKESMASLGVIIPLAQMVSPWCFFKPFGRMSAKIS
ncbi:uncharacterized protein LOC131244111 [Magnolia sinica]|uniref:uncharacterized protein LOC131244111 n=1 Tax=Magnolia sinica TaxID=86752 RepID=UPI00265A8928|nr:uncharacterized protein LOC131244111 [Magnolia sinica]